MINDLYVKNLRCLKEFRPALAAFAESLEVDDSTELVCGADGWLDLKQAGRYLYGGKPHETITACVNALNLAYPKLVIFYGMGLGYQIAEVLKRTGDVPEAILVIEKDAAHFVMALRTTDLTSLLSNNKASILIGTSEENLRKELYNFIDRDGRILFSRTLVAVTDPGILPEDESYYLNAATEIQLTCEHINTDVNVPPEDAFRGVVNYFQNLPACRGVPAFDHFIGLFEGMPGIAVSTGPSLEKSLPWLKEVGDRAVIACADSALKILLKNGITPHIVACLERVPETTLLFRDLPPLPNTFFVTIPIIWPETYQNYPGPKINFGRSGVIMEWFDPSVKTLVFGNSVSHLVVQALHKLGCSKVLLAGQDLAFDRHSTQTHATGIPEELKIYNRKRRDRNEAEAHAGNKGVLAEGNDGTPILTMPEFQFFNQKMAQLIDKMSIDCYNVIPPAYGAKIPFAKRLDPGAAPLAMMGPEKPVTKILRDRYQSIVVPTKAEFAAHIFNRLDEAIGHLKHLQKLSLEVMDAASLFWQKHDPNFHDEDFYRPLFTQLHTIIDEVLDDPNGFFRMFMGPIIYGHMLGMAQYTNELLASTLSHVDKVHGQFMSIHSIYSQTHLWSSRLLNYIERIYDELKSSLGETRPLPEIGIEAMAL